MASQPHGSKETHIKLHGRPASLVYDSTTRTVSVKLPDSGKSISQADIIGVAQVERRDTQLLIYVEPSEKKEGNSGDASIPIVKSSEAKDLPSAFVSEFAIHPQAGSQERGIIDRDSSPTTHIVVSSGSGTGLAPSFFSSVLEPLLSLLDYREHKDYLVHHTESARTIIELTENIILPQAEQGVAQRIILLTGDGGVVDIVNVLMHKDRSPTYKAPTIVLIPMGTGNALANSTGITRDNTWGLSTLARGTPKPLPLFKATFSPGAKVLVNEGNDEEELAIRTADGNPVLYGAVVCSWGLHASLVADSDTTEYRKYGHERFPMAGRENLFPSDGSPSHIYRARVSLLKSDSDGKESWSPIPRDEHSYVLATLVSNLEKTFVMSPASEPLDGHLRVVHFGHMSGEEVMQIMGQVYQGGKHVEDNRIGYEDVEGIRIDFARTEKDGRWRRICVDGTIIRVEENGWVEVTKETSNVVQLDVFQ